MNETITSPIEVRHALILANVIELIATNIVAVNLGNIHKEGYTPISIREARALAHRTLAKVINNKGEEDFVAVAGSAW